MEAIRALLQTEPARLISALAAIFGLLVGAGLMAQTRADSWVLIAGVLLPVLLPIIQGMLTRQSVFSPDTTQKLANAATFQDAGTEVDIGHPPDASPPLPLEG